MVASTLYSHIVGKQNMEQLSDDALLRVMRFLDVPSLLTCRLVCRRLGGLVLHADAWRHREVSQFNKTCVCPELRLAPCLRVLKKSSETATANSCLPAALAWTRCTVAELWLVVDDDVQAGIATALILKQAGLGRLRRLTVSIVREVSDSMVSMLLAAVVSVRGLEHIELSGTRRADLPSLQTTASVALGSIATTPSVKDFRCNYIQGAEPFVLFMLAAHSDTLETVCLGVSAPGMAVTSIAPLLAGVAHLRELSCCNLRGLEALAGLKSLRILRLTVSTATSDDRAACAGAIKLLRRAEHLRELILLADSPDHPGPAFVVDVDVVADIIRAPAASGRSRLESLTIFTVVSGPQVQALIGALPALPALQFLWARVSVKQDVNDLVQAITPTTAPALQKFLLDLPLTLVMCVHAWFHGDAFKTLVVRNPLLHFYLTGQRRYCGDKSCQACGRGCHATQLREMRRFFYYFLFWHDPENKCYIDHSVKYGRPWIHWVHAD